MVPTRKPISAADRKRLSVHRKAVAERLTMVRTIIQPNRVIISELFGVHHTVWQKWEDGRNYPDPEVMARFCDQWGVTMDWLFRGRMEGMREALRALMYEKNPELLAAEVAKAHGGHPAGNEPEPLPLPAPGARIRRRRKTNAN